MVRFAQRDWLITKQSPFSLTCIVNSAYLSSGLSKKVSRTQCLDFSGRAMEMEELFQLAKTELEITVKRRCQVQLARARM